jgi:hypothetical protein
MMSHDAEDAIIDLAKIVTAELIVANRVWLLVKIAYRILTNNNSFKRYMSC